MYKINLKKIASLIIVLCIAGFLRFYQLDQFPVQLNHDEISQLYDTASIGQTGKDIYGNFLPLAFPSTGDFKVGHYIYISLIPYFIFGLKEFMIRLPSAFFGTLEILAVFLFINQLTKNWRLSIISALLVAITPSEIFYSRKSFESVISASLTFFGLFMLFRFLEKPKQKLNIILTPILLVLPMYIYTSYTMVVPSILGVFYLFYKIDIKNSFKKFLYSFLLFIGLLIPLFLIIITNQGVRFRANSVFLLQDNNLIKQLNFIDLQNNVLNSIYKFKFIFEYGITKYSNQFDFSQLFAKGLDLTNQGTVGLGPMLLFQLPFFILGILFMLKDNNFKKTGKFILAIMAISVIPSGLTFEAVSPHRSVLAFSFMSIVSSFGMFAFYKFLNNYPIKLRLSVTILMVVFLTLNFLYAIHIYTVNYPNEKSQSIHFPYRDISIFAWSQYKNFDQIIVDPIYGQFAPVRAVAVHYYLAYYGNYSLLKFQKDFKIDKTGIYFDKFAIRDIDWRDDQKLKNTLIIASTWSVEINKVGKEKIIKTFYFYDKQPAFYAIKL